MGLTPRIGQQCHDGRLHKVFRCRQPNRRYSQYISIYYHSSCYCTSLHSSLSLAAFAAAESTAQWNEFADNFATDLSPIVALFGEQVTKQFLSESTGFLDNIIFGVAPLGILTAVVSAIRVYGNASLKSFIGRAQEAHGVAEAELCSSTSQDVCELWSNGGICRVFGPLAWAQFVRSGYSLGIAALQANVVGWGCDCHGCKQYVQLGSKLFS
ncbi:hypothetical protein QBC33DRAFT_541800 [Phialemonium atrogriseum]|uniref:Uncharacterized protein n=1 Tax=Phialemonium atrogriseum TaxID=1093897 RepID=A0AAJ0FKY4_9PEZI|nr:uncharacterized protein QBC33DRAFT_541800 [Phialemonium atrogriseum]KAK1766094.1 hypothetical protein QBC33DRAFT_541800 [Phialemonium atrogriseum]